MKIINNTNTRYITQHFLNVLLLGVKDVHFSEEVLQETLRRATDTTTWLKSCSSSRETSNVLLEKLLPRFDILHIMIFMPLEDTVNRIRLLFPVVRLLFVDAVSDPFLYLLDREEELIRDRSLRFVVMIHLLIDESLVFSSYFMFLIMFRRAFTTRNIFFLLWVQQSKSFQLVVAVTFNNFSFVSEQLPLTEMLLEEVLPPLHKFMIVSVVAFPRWTTTAPLPLRRTHRITKFLAYSSNELRNLLRILSFQCLSELLTFRRFLV